MVCPHVFRIRNTSKSSKRTEISHFYADIVSISENTDPHKAEIMGASPIVGNLAMFIWCSGRHTRAISNMWHRFESYYE